MKANLIEVSPSAYEYPLLIKHLLHYPMTHAPDQEIVYRDLRRHSYRLLAEETIADSRMSHTLRIRLMIKPGAFASSMQRASKVTHCIATPNVGNRVNGTPVLRPPAMTGKRQSVASIRAIGFRLRDDV